MLRELQSLYDEAEAQRIVVDQRILRASDMLDGLFLSWGARPIILINHHRPISVQTVALAEELGHFHKSFGVIVPQVTTLQRKSEAAGRAWSYDEVLPATELNVALRSGTCMLWELSELFNLPEEFISEAMAYYKRKSALVGNASCHWCYFL